MNARGVALLTVCVLVGCPPTHMITRSDAQDGRASEDGSALEVLEQPDAVAVDGAAEVLEQPDDAAPESGPVAETLDPSDAAPVPDVVAVVDVVEISTDAPPDAQAIDPNWDSFACGAAMVRCPDLGGAALCQGGQCRQTVVSCPGTCTACASDDVCNGYAEPGLTYNANGANAHPFCCHGTCVAAGDRNNCGGCGIACHTNQACGWRSPTDLEVSCF